MRIFNWRLSSVVCERKSDNTLWAPAGDCPFPINGWNFVRLKKAKIGWWMDFNKRWAFTDSSLFEVTHK